jgi:hypothetical protein
VLTQRMSPPERFLICVYQRSSVVILIRRFLGLIEGRFGKAFPDGLLHTAFLLRPKPAAVNPASNGIQQFQPILQGRFRDVLPHVVALFPGKEQPVAAHMLRVDLQREPLFTNAFPTDFSFWHGC